MTADTDHDTGSTDVYIVESSSDAISLWTRLEATDRQAAIDRFINQVTSHAAVSDPDTENSITTHTAIGGASVELTLDIGSLVAYPDTEDGNAEPARHADGSSTDTRESSASDLNSGGV